MGVPLVLCFFSPLYAVNLTTGDDPRSWSDDICPCLKAWRELSDYIRINFPVEAVSGKTSDAQHSLHVPLPATCLTQKGVHFPWVFLAVLPTKLLSNRKSPPKAPSLLSPGSSVLNHTPIFPGRPPPLAVRALLSCRAVGRICRKAGLLVRISYVSLAIGSAKKLWGQHLFSRLGGGLCSPTLTLGARAVLLASGWRWRSQQSDGDVCYYSITCWPKYSSAC